MLIQLCLYHAGKQLQGDVINATDRMIQVHADNLHVYYTQHQKVNNYSARLAKMMKINGAIEKGLMERKEQHYIAQVFNVFSVDFTHPEMFEGT
uniref:NR LBD domain-containing protein n=1 Tax=Caenorhabditis japonica TaxID=281687 RepID=A0A8R1EX31_CAEJA